jgi:SUKH-3 immunity protein of toxin-antitoxin system/YwqJ-like deaminase
VLVISDYHDQTAGSGDAYGQARLAAPDGAPVLRRRRDGILPTTAAALSLPGADQPLTGTASRAVGVPELHPVVRDVLDGLGVGQRERHLGRCPEVALLSRCLAEAGAATLDEARAALHGAGLTTRHIREDGDPQHGAYAPNCRPCAVLLARLGVRSFSTDPGVAGPAAWGMPGTETWGGGLATGGPWSVGTIDQALADAGWQPGRRHAAQAEKWADALSGHRSPHGRPHSLFPAAFETWAEYGSLRLRPTGPGVAYAPSPLTIDPLRGLHWTRTLGDLAHALDTELCPLGEEGEGGGTAVLAIDREGRVYCIDHTGDWYLGPDVRAALTTLLTGARPERLSLGP